MAEPAGRGSLLSTLSPKFLHSNSTSHTWPFSAIAELIDNAYDPDVNAREFWIDKTVVQGQECLTFMDNGNGLTYELMHKMLSFGYSDKTASHGKEPIGIYGNGFKSGSMRLGSDVMFSKSKDSRCVGMLSQTYLEKINAEQIIVPIVCFKGKDNILYYCREEHKASLEDILLYSPFRTVEELLQEVEAITSPPLAKTGTRIIIWNLRRTSTNTTEFDFETDRYDIRIPTEVSETLKDIRSQSSIPECFHSLRAYCSILYLKPRMQIIVRGQKVKTQLMAKSLALVQKDHYKPNFLPKRVPITFGYNTKSKEQYGVMMYHKNRLIKAYKRVGCQLKGNDKGVGVIGVIECNFLDPTHNKQSFIETEKYSKTIASLGIKLEDYWNEIRHKRTKENPNSIPVEDAEKSPDQNWVQCDECLKWRKLPDGINCSKLPDKWFCRLNPDPQFRSCHVEEEPEDSDTEQPRYQKTYKKHKKGRFERKDSRSPNNNSLPVITDVCSLSPGFLRCVLVLENRPLTEFSVMIRFVCYRGKRTLPTIPQETPKRQKHDGLTEDMSVPYSSAGEYGTDMSVAYSPAEESPVPSPSLLDDNNNNTSDTDDDLFIVENTVVENTPVAGKPGSDAGTSTDAGAVTVGTNTHTEKIRVKEEPQSQNEEEMIQKQVDHVGKSFCAVTRPFEGINADGSTRRSSPRLHVGEPQEGQVALYAAAQERDALKEQVQALTVQLQEAQDRLKELMESTVKKEYSHQFVQTEEGSDYKHLFVKVKQKIADLIKDNVSSVPTAQAQPRAQGEEGEFDEVVQPVEFLIQELKQRNKERDELCSQLDVVQNERTELVKQCAEQKLVLQQRETALEGSVRHRATEETAYRSLISLRHNISRLLVTFVPALELDQVNYECDVIDEILEQVLIDVESGGT
uniref:MORC family CW-type zinc finger 3a n=1 Tax=Tetraodon nigroviridis TaxID=99883 RepID=H3D8V5_TETNG